MYQVFQAFKLVFSYINNYPKFWLYFTLRIITTAINVSVPVVVGYIIVLLTRHSEITVIYYWLSFLGFIVLIGPIIDRFAFVNGWFLSFRIAHDFRQDAVKKLRHVGLYFWQENDKGNVMKIIDQAFEHVIFIAGSIINSYVPFFGKLIGIILATSFIDPVIGILLFIDCLFTVINIKVILPKESDAGILERKAQESVYGRINEYLTNYKTVVYLNLFDKQDKEIFQYNENAYEAYQKRERLSGLKWYFNSQMNAFFVITTIIYAIWQVLQGHLQLGLLTTIVFFSLNIADYMVEGIWNISESVRYANSIKRYQDTFKDIMEHDDDTDSLSIDFNELSLRHVSLQQKERETLQNINLTVKKGEKIAIVGFTGSGKTTLIDILLKAITTYSGEIYINNYNYQELHVKNIAKIYSIVPQEVQLFQGSIEENITIHKTADGKDIDKVIQVAGLASLIEKLPKGKEEHIHEAASNISGGERQRIGIARSLLQNHPILILDEATASLDPKTEREVVTNIITNYPDMTILYITHKYSLLNVFDEIIVMNDGSIIEKGSFASLIKKGGLFKDLFHASKLQ